VPQFGAPYAPSERELPTLVGPYRVLRSIARGSTCDVLLARQVGPLGFERTVALKILLPELRDDDESSRALAREGSVCARLSHPAIAQVYGFVVAGGEVGLALEYVEGLPLNDLRAGLHRRGEPLGDEAALFIASRLFGALAAAHGARDPLSREFAPVVHADVNPSNLVVPWDGYVKLVDFGSAHVPGGPRVPRPPLADRPYAAPEQARGEEATARSDVYSACLVLWELLTARRAIARGRQSSRELLDAMASPALPPLGEVRPDLPKTLRDVVTRGLERDPDRRDVMAEEICGVLRVVSDPWRGRSALCESLGVLRLSTLHRDPLETTPSLPETARSEPFIDVAVIEPPPAPYAVPRPAPYAVPPPAPYAAHPPPPYAVHRSERPVVVSSPAPTVTRSRQLRWLALPVSLAVAGCAAILFFQLSPSRTPEPLQGPARLVGALPVLSGSRPAARPAPVLPAAFESRSAVDAATASPPQAAPEAQAQSTLATPSFATVTVPPSRAGHRVWIDGRLVGGSPGAFRVSCGTHVVRVGSHGVSRSVDVGCGESAEVR
jgi:serine/threonine protein kinase